MKKLKVLILGSGGREHALAWKISQSPLLADLFICPGNAGTSECGTNISMSILDFASVKQFILNKSIHLLIIGPEEPLVKGLVNYLNEDTLLKDLLIIGPESDGAALEGSKSFAKQFMIRHNIPTARYSTFDASTIKQGEEFLKSLKPPYVLKADGLAAGKGVVICNSIEDATQTLQNMLVGKQFGSASENVVIEEFLKGIELSVFALTDGEHFIILPEAKDYKRVGENDSGPNTGGMGSISPVPFADAGFMRKVEERVIRPTVKGLNAEGIRYCGFIFAGLMNVEGDPYVIEYNVRLGDPETEAIMPRIESDLLEILIKTAQGKLDEVSLKVDPRTAACVMLVSGGYPGSFNKGIPIHINQGIERSFLFHAGTIFDSESRELKTSGGRVIAAVSKGNDIQQALRSTYGSIGNITFEGMNYRKDIGKDLIA